MAALVELLCVEGGAESERDSGLYLDVVGKRSNAPIVNFGLDTHDVSNETASDLAIRNCVPLRMMWGQLNT